MFKDYNKFDIGLGLYHWLQHNCEGQTDDLYSDFCKLKSICKPGADPLFDNIDEQARDVYDMLKRDNYKDALTIVLNYKSE